MVLETGIFTFMAGLDLHYGRLDFLLDETGSWFLEVNPSGLRAWPDAIGEHGLLDKMVEETLAVDLLPLPPVPVPRFRPTVGAGAGPVPD